MVNVFILGSFFCVVMMMECLVCGRRDCWVGIIGSCLVCRKVRPLSRSVL